MPLTVTENPDGSVRITYDLSWLLELMEVSCTSMVPFTFFTTQAVSRGRVYPRSRDNPGFILGPKDPKDSSASGGGRKHEDGSLRVGEICDLFTDAHRGLSIPLSDVAILSKRAVGAAVRAGLKKPKNFQVMRGLGARDKRDPGFPVHEYPMLCIIGGPSAQFPRDQAEWRVVQCVVGAVLTRAIRERRIGIEVVSREGFGSLFPTLADLPDGIRLDPGLLPPDEGSQAIIAALGFADDFITAMRGKIKAKPPAKSKATKNPLEDLGGMYAPNLAAVDRLMSALHVAAQAKSKLTPDQCADLVLAWTGKSSDCDLPALKANVEYVLANALPEPAGPRKKRVSEPEKESGYGSESDYEDEDDEPVPKKKASKGDGDEQLDGDGALAVKKASVVSGMAALRMAQYYGMVYSKASFGKEGAASGLVTWAPYFELHVQELYDGLQENSVMPPGVRVLVCDGAPNPINIPDAPIKLTKDFGVILIDTTNCTSAEKAASMVFFQEYLVQPTGPKERGGLLFMVDSASKHPTGGDLVHGVMRVCGSRGSVKFFFLNALKRHLMFGNKAAKGLTVLSDEETAARRQMIACRLLMRNGDLFNPGAASKSGVSGKGSSKKGSSGKGGSGKGKGDGGPGAPVDIPDIPLSALANLRKVKRIALDDAPDQAPELLKDKKEKKASSKGADPSGKPSEDLSKKELAKAFEALGSFDDDGELPDLTEDGLYYEAENIYDLQRYKLRNHAHVAVIHGVSRPQWLQMSSEAYTTAYQFAITTNTTIIIQPLNRNGNHWALLYIMLSAPGDDGQRRARLLYIDPLHPDDVPVEDLALLNRPFPGIEVEHCVLQYQNDGIAQHSCGAWAVMLAEHLVTHAHALPDVADNPRTAAEALREQHNPILATAHDHPWPVAPAALLHVHGPQGQVHVANMPGLLPQIPDGRRSPDKPASLGDLMRKGKSSPDDHF